MMKEISDALQHKYFITLKFFVIAKNLNDKKFLNFPFIFSLFKEQSPKMKLSGRCSALVLSPSRLMRVFSERKKLYG